MKKGTREELRKEFESALRIEHKTRAAFLDAEAKADEVRHKSVIGAQTLYLKKKDMLRTKLEEVTIPADNVYKKAMAPFRSNYVSALHAREAIQERIKQIEVNKK